jgi:hypothetical protein
LVIQRDCPGRCWIREGGVAHLESLGSRMPRNAALAVEGMASFSICTSLQVWQRSRGAAMLQKTPAEQENRLRSIIQTFDPDVPGYVFWLVMLMIIAFHQLVLHVR